MKVKGDGLLSQLVSNYQEQLNNAEMPAGKKKVLKTALTLFANNGFHATTTAKIAKAAKISEGTIYKYFNSKDDLLKTLIEPILIETRNNFFKTIDESKPLAELLDYIVKDRINFIEINFDFIRVILQEVLTNQLPYQTFSTTIKGKNGVIDQIKMLQNNYPEINQKLSPIQIIRIIVGPILTYISQTKILNIPTEPNDLKLIQKQIITNLTM